MTPTEPVRRRRPRWPVQPSLLLGLLPLVAFAAVSAWRSRPSDDYATLGQTVDSVVHALVLPESIAVLVLCVYVTALGWWPVAAVDHDRTPLRWTSVTIVLIAVVCAARLPLVDWSALPVRYFVLLTLGVLFVGVFEELLTRGVLLVGLRRRLPEFGVWIASCALFGLLHLLNVLAGAAVGATLLQVGFAASFGSTLYLARRLTGNLLLPVLLHAFWDFGSIAVSATVDTTDLGRLLPVGIVSLVSFGVLALGLVAGGLVAWRDDRPRRLRRRWRDVPPAGVDAGRGAEPSLQAGV